MLCFDREKSRFNFRVGGVCIVNDRLLVEKNPKYDFYVVPGGRCEFHESTQETVLREIFEEIGQKASIDRLLWIVESFFHLDGKDFHEISFFYKIQFSCQAFCQRQGIFEGVENKPGFTYQWLPLKGNQNFKIFPDFLQKRAYSLPESVEHLILKKHL